MPVPDDLETPCAVVDSDRLERNLSRMAAAASAAGGGAAAADEVYGRGGEFRAALRALSLAYVVIVPPCIAQNPMSAVC